VSVSASDALGLASNPSQAGLAIDTSRAGFFSIQRTATNRCGHSTTATFNYQVLPKPVLGKSVTIGLVSGKVYLRLPPKAKGSAHTSAACSHISTGRSTSSPTCIVCGSGMARTSTGSG